MSEEKLFENSNELKNFIYKLTNNSLIIDYILKYENLLNYDIIEIIFEKFNYNI